MKDSTKITLIYVGVGLFALCAISGFVILGKLRDIQAAQGEQNRKVIIERIDAPQVYSEITKDLRGVNQAGEDVGLQDLKGKVWVIAQFYSRCHQCVGHNRAVLKEIHDRYKDNPNFHLVTISLDEEHDTPTELARIAPSWGADPKTWWMLHVDVQELAKFGREQLLYFDFKENEGAPVSDKIQHDMSLAVIDSNMQMRAKTDLFTIKGSGDEELYNKAKSTFTNMIDWCLLNKQHIDQQGNE